MFVLLAISFLMVSNCQMGSAFKCYNCTDTLDKNCADPFNKRGLSSMDCPTGVCVKFTAPTVSDVEGLLNQLASENINRYDDKDLAEAMESLIKSMGPEMGLFRECNVRNYCKTLSKQEFNGQIECHECEGELCNSSPYLLPSLTIIVFLCVFKELISKWHLS